MKKLIRLHPDDNVAVALTALQMGETLELDGRTVSVADDVAPGHKLALRPIAEAEKVRRNAVPIGSATRAIRPGEHVHLHNLRSDYIPTLNRHYNDREVPS